MTQKEDIQNAVDVMRKGGVILYPTDTVWGIGCDATNAEAVAKVYRIKQRDDSKRSYLSRRLGKPRAALCARRAASGVGLDGARGEADNGGARRRCEPRPEPHRGGWQHSSARDERAVLEGALLSLPEALS